MLISDSNLFPGGVPTSDTQNIDLKLDTSLGNGDNGEDPEESAFGMVVMSGIYNAFCTILQ